MACPRFVGVSFPILAALLLLTPDGRASAQPATAAPPHSAIHHFAFSIQN